MKEGFDSYSFKQRKGIDDLLCEYAWIGNSQGDTSATNDTIFGKNSRGWMSFVFKDINPDDQEAINAESERRKKANMDYIEKLKSEGRFGEEYEISIHLKHNPIFDRPKRNG
jgi:hypothetical protein